MHNIEKSAFRKNEYVGYSAGVWHIRRISRNHWRATRRDAPYGVADARTLRELSDLLANYRG